MDLGDREAVIQRVRLELYRDNVQGAIRLLEEARAARPDPEYAAQLARIRSWLGHLASPDAYATAYERYYHRLRARVDWKRLEKEIRALLGRRTRKVVERAARDPEFRLLEREVEAAGARRVLDAGCGEGRLALALAARHPGIRVDAVDVSATNVRLARRMNRFANCAFHRALIEKAGEILPAGAFDLAYTFAVLEHVRDLGETLRAIERLLRPGGRLCLSVPMNEFEVTGPLPEFPYEDDHPGHVRVFTEAELRELFGHRDGFVLEKVPGELPDRFPPTLRPVEFGTFFVAFSTDRRATTGTTASGGSA